MEKYQEGYAYHIKDEFFDKINEKIANNNLMQNKENGNYRPTFYCMKDKTTDLLWVVPLSSRVDQKYQKLHDDQVEKYGSCLKIVIGEYDDKKAAFLLQNMFPITEKYLDHVHTKNGNPVPVKLSIQEEVRANMKRLRQLVKRGKKVVFTDINKIEQLMLDELAQEKEKVNKLDAKIVHADERRVTKDTYLESQRATLEACDLVLQNKSAFPAHQIARAEQIKAETLKNIKKREQILRDGH